MMDKLRDAITAAEKWRKEAIAAHRESRQLAKLVWKAAQRIEQSGYDASELLKLVEYVKRYEEKNPL